MFERIGNFTSKYRWPVVIVWIALLVTITILAPDLGDVASSDQAGFLGNDELSVKATQILAKYFPEQAPPSAAALVVESQSGSLRDEDAQVYLAELGHWLQRDLAPGLVTQVFSPADPALADQLISPDGQAGFFMVGFGSAYGNPVADAIEAMRAHLQDAPEGLRGYVTGDPAILSDYTEAAIDSFDSTLIYTIVLVVTTLLTIYRSPVSPLIPLFAVAVAFGISRALVAWLAEAGLPIGTFTETLLVVILFGAGTDYNLFLVSRFRGFMADKLPARAAAQRTVGRVGETITASAGTVIVGMLAASFAEFKLYANLGPSLAIGVVVGLLVGLTLTPALLALLGRWAFWPRRPRRAGKGGFWGRVSDWVTARPGWQLTLSLIILLPLAVYGLGVDRTVDLLGDLPDDVESKAGFEIIADKFGTGMVAPLNIIMTDIPDTRSPEGIAYVDALTEELLEVEGVGNLSSLALPLGRHNPGAASMLRVRDQLTLIAGEMDGLRTQVSDPSALAGVDPRATSAQLERLRSYLDELAASFPELSADADYLAVRDAFERLSATISDASQGSLDSNQLGGADAVQAVVEALVADLDAFQGALYTLADSLGDEAFFVPAALAHGAEADLLAMALDNYASPNGEAARLVVMLEDEPYSQQALATVNRLRDKVGQNSMGSVQGISASFRDIYDVTGQDMVRIAVLVLGGISIVLVLLIRSIVAPIYMLLTILLSYTTTMGIARLVFEDILDKPLIFSIPLLLFIFLVALGMDYNIFLMGRVKEEVAKHGTRRGIREALENTGGIISSAGIIMAGTFAAMMTSSLMALVQLGFAVAVGVLLDTFLIRTTLVPAIAVLLDRWNWWPGKAPTVPSAPPALEPNAAD